MGQRPRNGSPQRDARLDLRLVVGLLALAMLPASASAQQPAPPGPAPESAAASDAQPAAAAVDARANAERLWLALQPATNDLNKLTKELPPADLLDAVVVLLRQRPHELDDLQRHQALSQLVAARAYAGARSIEQDSEVAEVLVDALAAPVLRRACIYGALQLRPEVQPEVVPAVVACLEDPDWYVVKQACDVLGKLGPVAHDALPRLRDVLAQPDAMPAASAPPPDPDRDPLAGYPGVHQLAVPAWPDVARREAATARMWIARDAVIDVALYADLDAAGQKAALSAVAEAAAFSGGCFDGIEAHAQALAAYLLGQLERSGGPASRNEEWGWMALMMLTRDGIGEPARGRALALLEQLSHSTDAKVGEAAGQLLSPPETICCVTSQPAADPRVTTVFRPRSGLVTAAATPAGPIAVSGSARSNCFHSWREPDPELLTLHLWDVRSGLEVQRIDGIPRASCIIRLSPDGERLLVGRMPDADGGESLVLRTADGKLHRIPITRSAARSTLSAFLADGRVVLVDSDGLLTLWDFEAAREGASFAMESSPAIQLAASPDGVHLLVAGMDGRLRLLALEDGAWSQQRVLLEPVPDPKRAAPHRTYNPKCPDYPFATALAILPDGHAALCADNFGDLVIRDLATGDVLRALTSGSAAIRSLAVSADGRFALAGSGGLWADGQLSQPTDFTVRLFDLRDGTEVTRFTGMQSSVCQVGFAADGTAVMALADQAFREWKLDPQPPR